MTWHYVYSQNTIISFEDGDFWQKIFLILYSSHGTLTTHISQLIFIYRIVASSNVHYSLGNQCFVKRSQYIMNKNPLHKQSACASKRDVLELVTLRYVSLASSCTY